MILGFKSRQNSFHAYDVLLDESQGARLIPKKFGLKKVLIGLHIGFGNLDRSWDLFGWHSVDTKFDFSNQRDHKQSDILKCW